VYVVAVCICTQHSCIFMDNAVCAFSMCDCAEASPTEVIGILAAAGHTCKIAVGTAWTSSSIVTVGVVVVVVVVGVL
jgi:hypothetical protein